MCLWVCHSIELVYCVDFSLATSVGILSSAGLLLIRVDRAIRLRSVRHSTSKRVGNVELNSSKKLELLC
jgi:hypothetical protein